MDGAAAAIAADINSCKYLYLMELAEPRANRLRLIVQEAGRGIPAARPTELGLPLASKYAPIVPDGRKFEIFWDYYLGYGVRNEAHVGIDPYEERDGRLFAVYRRSRFLDYLALACHTHEVCGDPLTHWGINCLNHIVDVVGPGQPKIRFLD